jgi:hypothetical protein
MVLVCVATLFVMPASTALAASVPVPIFMDDQSVIYEFQPDPLYSAGGGTESFEFVNYYGPSGQWYVPAGNNFRFQIITKEPNTTIRMTIYKNGVQVSDYVVSSTIYGYFVDITTENTNNQWKFVVTPYSSATISIYAGTVIKP